MPPALSVLEKTFGYSSFRGQQAEIIQTVVDGGDALVLMPTGGGKSLCYQIPALVRQGTGVVISPLIALMQDQVDALAAVGARAAFLNSTLSGRDADTHVVPIVERIEDRHHLVAKLRVLRIHRRTIHNDRSDVVLHVDFDELE